MRHLLVYDINEYLLLHSNTEQVCYLGFDYKKKKMLQEKGIPLLDISLILSKISDEMKYDFIDYIASVGEIQKNKVMWWSTRIASKINLQTDFYSIVCLIMAADELIVEKSCNVFITDDWRVFFTIKNKFECFASAFSQFKARIAFFKSISFYTAKYFLSRLKWMTRILIKNNTFKKYLNQVKGKAVFIFSWVEERSFNNEGEYNDPYFPGIEKFVSQQSTVLLLPYYVNPSFFSRLKKTGKALVGMPYYSSIKIILQSLPVVYRINFNPLFKGVDLKYLWTNEILRENCGSHLCQQLHDFKCWEMFFQDHKGKVLYPYENQPWEKVMIMAASKRAKTVEFIGYQHSAIGKILFNYHTTPREISIMPRPDTIVANSAPNFQFLNNMYKDCGVKVLDGGALRYAEPPDLKTDCDYPKRLGVFLPNDIRQSCELFTDVINNKQSGFEFLIKYHPDLPLDFKINKSNVRIFLKSARELYGIVSGVVYCSSTVGLEAYSCGIPVFRFQGQFIDLRMGEYIFEPKVITSVNEISDQHLVLHQEKNLFGAINNSVWMNILN